MKTRGRQTGFERGVFARMKETKGGERQTKGRSAAANLLAAPESEGVTPPIAIKERRALRTPANTQLMAAAAPPTERTNSGLHDNEQNIAAFHWPNRSPIQKQPGCHGDLSTRRPSGGRLK